MYTSLDEIYRIFLSNGRKITTDSRKIEAGSLYLALKGDRFDGNQFALQAIEQGASMAICDDKSLAGHQGIVLVESGLSCLQNLAALYRQSLNTRIIGIAGSNGKTTTKELTAAVLSSTYKTAYTLGNLNNHIGVPLTILSIPPDAEFAVIELGANHPGEVAELCKIADPEFGIITSIGKEHLEGFGSLEAVIEAECELYDHIRQRKGTLFVNYDDPILKEKSADYRDCMFYGKDRSCDCIGSSPRSELFVRFRWETSFAALPAAPIVSTQLVGAYNFYNLLAAACIGRYFSVPYPSINAALEAYSPKNNRSQLKELDGNQLILDCYNANPSSMEKALDHLGSIEHPQKIAILGDMFELGEASEEEHRNILNYAEKQAIHKIWVCGESFFKAATELTTQKTEAFPSLEALKKAYPIGSLEKALVLLKASRGMKLETWLD